MASGETERELYTRNGGVSPSLIDQPVGPPVGEAAWLDRRLL